MRSKTDIVIVCQPGRQAKTTTNGLKRQVSAAKALAEELP
jgi:hypothetical protein